MTEFSTTLQAAGRRVLAEEKAARWHERRAIKAIGGWIGLGGSLVLLLIGSGPVWLYAPVTGLALAIHLMIGHERLHEPRPHRSLHDYISGSVAGLSADYWRAKHNRIHHVGAGGNDTFGEGPVDMGLVARLAPGQPWRPWHRLQVVYLPLLATLELQQLIAESLRFARTGAIGDVAIVGTPSLGWKIRQHLAALGVPALLLATGSLVHGPQATLLTAVAVVLVCGTVLSSVLAVEVVRRGLGDPGEVSDADAWARWQVERTMIIDTHPLIEWVIGGLNRHTAHHLFPTAPSHALPALTDIVAASCAAYGVTLHRYASLRASWVEVGHYLWALGKDPRCSTSTAVEC